jgi:hypothetical protein
MMNKSLCTNNGEVDYSLRICKFNKGWTDSDCSRNENCIDKFCKNCKSGWNGSNCEIKTIETCSSKCLLNGICVNNTCICSLGFQGRNSEVNSCPNSCSSHGICDKLSNQDNKYQCVCNYGWTGTPCDFAM